jgi:hypothetical protein
VRSISVLLISTLFACAADEGRDDTAATLGSASDTSEASTADTSDTSPGSTDHDTTGATDPETTGATANPDDDSTGIVLNVPEGVFLWTGSGGGGPGTDLHPDAVEQVLVDAGIDVALGDVLPADFADRFGTLVYMNPREDFDPAVDSAALDLVASGGRLVLVMEHCKNGCWGNAPGHNALLDQLGSTVRLHGDGGAPLSDTALTITDVGPLTDGVNELVVYYSGHVELGSATALGTIPGGDVVIGWQAVGPGEVVAIADSSILGYRLDAADNRQLIENFASH